MKKVTIIRAIFIVLIILWAIMVFNLSNQVGNDSGGLSAKITSIFFKSEEMVSIAEPYIRKIANLSEYALGGMLFMGLFFSYDWKEKNKIIISILIGIWYAITDEVHQTFVSDRTGSIIDVGIDSIGIALGVFIMLFLIKIIEKILKKNMILSK